MEFTKWRHENIISENMRYRAAAISSMDWIYYNLGRNIGQDITVEAVHNSKSIELPVVMFSWGEIKVLVRFNFHDWCVRIYDEQNILPEPPAYLVKNSGTGFYEGMDVFARPTWQYCFSLKEDLYALLSYYYNFLEDIKAT